MLVENNYHFSPHTEPIHIVSGFTIPFCATLLPFVNFTEFYLIQAQVTSSSTLYHTKVILYITASTEKYQSTSTQYFFGQIGKYCPPSSQILFITSLVNQLSLVFPLTLPFRIFLQLKLKLHKIESRCLSI